MRGVQKLAGNDTKYVFAVAACKERVTYIISSSELLYTERLRIKPVPCEMRAYQIGGKERQTCEVNEACGWQNWVVLSFSF